MINRDELKAEMQECLQLCDGRYYATDAGCKRLENWLRDRGFPGKVFIEDGRYEISQRGKDEG